MPYCPFCGKKTGFVPEPQDYEYEAFVSYRHLPLDMKVAKRLQHDLEAFPIPKDLWENVGRKRLGRLFRDEDELPASTSLSDRIRDALARSRFLIVICTPETKKNHWVEREIQLFASLHGRDRIVIALAEGERSQCLPDILLYERQATADGTVTSEPTEPLAADFRRSSHKSRRDETLRIVAALLGCGFDDLRQRDKVRRRKLLACLAALIMAVASAFAVVTMSQQARIDQSQGELAISQARDTALQADGLLGQQDRYAAIEKVLLELRGTDDGTQSVPELQATLERAVQAYPTEHAWLPLYRNRQDRSVEHLAVCGEAKTYATVDDRGLLSIFQIQSGSCISELSLGKPDDADEPSWSEWTFEACGGRYLVYSKFESTLFCVDAAKGELLWTYDMPGGIYALRGAADGSVACLTGISPSNAPMPQTGTIHIVDLSSGKALSQASVPVDDYSTSHVSIDESTSYACATFGRSLVIVDKGGSILVTAQLEQPLASDVIWSGDTAMALSVNEMGADFPVTAQAFTTSSNDPVWTHRDHIAITVQNGQGLMPTAEFCGGYTAGNTGTRMLMGLGSRLLSLDVANGETAIIGEYDSAVCSVGLVTGREGTWARVRTVYDLVEEKLDGRILGLERSSIDLGPTSMAVFETCEGDDYLFALPFEEDFSCHASCAYKLAVPLANRFAQPTPEAQAFSAGSAKEPTSDETTIEKALGKATEAAFVSQDGKVAVAQSQGMLYCVDLVTKAIRSASDTSYGTLANGGFTDDGQMFFATTSDPNHLGEDKLLVFDLDRPTLVPKSEITHGVSLSSDGSSVLIKTTGTSYTLPYLTLDQLVKRGTDLLDDARPGKDV